MTAGFQQTVNVQPAPAVAGDFASANPRASVLAGPGALVAGPSGVTVGRFAWVDAANQTLVSNYGPYGQAPTGFVHREQQALITQYLAETSNLVPSGFGITLMSAGDYWVTNDGSAETLVGNYVYANYADGKVSTNAANNAPSTASVTGAVTAGSSSSTGSIAGNVLTVTAVGSGTLVVGTTLSGTNVASNTMITAQISGTAGGIGTYYVNIPDQVVASTTLTGSYGILTVSAVSSGVLSVGQTISGGSATGYITAYGTGAGGTGTYFTSDDTTQTSTTITADMSVLTKYRAMTAAPVGGLFKMSSWPIG